MRAELTRQLKGDEGVKAQAYQDHLGFWTIGVGRLIDARKPGSGLRPEEIIFLLNNDIEDRIDQLARRLPWFLALDAARQGVLLNMSFQLGVDGLLGFRNTLKLVELGDYARAADNMLLSKWATQTPERARRMAAQMRSGQWQYAEGT
jgi:lysozyme